MGLKKKLIEELRRYTERSVLPNAYDAMVSFMEKGKRPTYEEYLDMVLSLMKGKKEDESC